jgi:hypothetical protein
LGCPKRAFEQLARFACRWTLALLACIGSVSSARGETRRDWLEHYDVAANCPNEAEFRMLVQQRLVDSGEALGRLRVRVDISRGARSGSLIGSLWVDDAAGRHLEREVDDPSCTALVHALSLVVALSTDDSALAPGIGIGAQPPSREPGDPWGEAPDPFAPEPVDQRPSEPRDSFVLGPLAIASMQSALAPEPLLGLGLGAAFEWETAGAWSPRFEVAGMRFERSEATLSSGLLLTRYEAWIGNASFCPVRVGSGEPWSLRPCADLDAGRLTASGSGRGVISPQQRHAPWASSGLSLRAAVAPFSGPVQLAATLGGFLALFQHEFYFAPDIEAFEVPAFGWRASARAAVAF